MIIEEIIVKYLNGVLDIPVYTEEPETPSGTYCIVSKSGGSDTDGVKRADIDVLVYAPSMYEAASLNEDVKDAMKSLSVLDEICSCGLDTDLNFTDTTQKRYRYRSLYTVYHY